jgi:hypothetical protein
MSRYNDPVSNIEEITPSDSAAFKMCHAIYVGGMGDVAIVAIDGSTAIFKGVPSGKEIPVLAIKVLATGTTATSLVAMRKATPKIR